MSTLRTYLGLLHNLVYKHSDYIRITVDEEIGSSEDIALADLDVGIEEPNIEDIGVQLPAKKRKLDPSIYKKEFVKDMAHFYAIKEFGQHFLELVR